MPTEKDQRESSGNNTKALREVNSISALLVSALLLIVILAAIGYFKSVQALLSPAVSLFIGVYALLTLVWFMLLRTTDWANRTFGIYQEVKQQFTQSENVVGLFGTVFAWVMFFLVMLLALGLGRSRNDVSSLAGELDPNGWMKYIALFFGIVLMLFLYFFGANHTLASDTTDQSNRKPLLLFYGLTTFLVLFACLAAFTVPGVAGTLSQYETSIKWFFSVGLFLIVLVWFIATLFSSNSAFARYGINVALLIAVLAFIYRVTDIQLPAGSKIQSGFSFLYYAVFYGMCFLNAGLDGLVGTIFGTAKVGMISLAVTGFSIAGLLAMRYYPMALNPALKLGGQSVLNEPVSIAMPRVLRTLPKDDQQLAVSFWFFLPAAGANTSAAYNRDALIVSVGDAPRVVYNAKQNRLRLVSGKDNNSKEILYEATNVPLQRWNNIVLNYDSGVLDVFLNNQLVHSVGSYVPLFGNAGLLVGETDGIDGDVCNVMLFDKPLSSARMKVLYNLTAARTPPILFGSDKTAIDATAEDK